MRAVTNEYNKKSTFTNGCFVHHHGDPALDKVERETRTLTEFAKAWQRQYGRPCEALDLASAANLITDAGTGASIDGVLVVDGTPVAVELVGYRPVGDRGKGLDLDHEFRFRIASTIGDFLVDNGVAALSIRYRAHIEHNIEERVVETLRVPHKSQWDALSLEVRACIEASREYWGRCDRGKQFYFREQSAFLHDPRLRVSIAGNYPLMTSDVSNIHVTPHRGTSQPSCEIRSNMSGGCVGLDADWLESILRQKVAKSALSATRACDLALWLIVHTDELSINQNIPEPHLDRVPEVCRTALKHQPHHFARVYWCHNTGYLDAATIVTIHE